MAEAPSMKVEVLYFDGCPGYETAVKKLEDVLFDKGLEAEVELVSVGTDEEAELLRFPGSPTIRVDGQDLFPIAGRPTYALVCRTYITEGGLRSSPTVPMLRDALEKLSARS